MKAVHEWRFSDLLQSKNYSIPSIISMYKVEHGFKLKQQRTGHSEIARTYFTELGTALTTILPILFQYCYKYCYSDSRNL
jgi:hypothetical protein